MFPPVVLLFRWFWSDVLLPYVVLALAALVSDGVEAWANIGETLYVICCFLGGRSHRAYPLSKKALDKGKKLALEYLKAEEKKVRGAAEEDSADGAASEENGNARSTGSEDASKRGAASPTLAGSGANVEAVLQAVWGEHLSHKDDGRRHPVFIQRRVLLGKKGERELWLDAVLGRPLVPLSLPQSYSHSLHHLVRSVVGPIQQPTVTTMPARHMAPQWPPHFVRSSTTSGGGGGRGVAGGGGVDGHSAASTDDYSSSNGRLRRRVEGGAGSSSSTGEGGVGLAGTSSAMRRGGAGDYQQKAKVVYKRLSKRQVEFQPTRKHAYDAHAIASITAHHVLSYRATRQKVLVIDLDETLCHVSTSTANMLGPPTFSEVIPTATGAELFHVWERPHVRLFLETMSKLFNLVLFTSASKPYADTILRRIDPNYLLKERYYRQDCRVVSRGALAKTLREKRLATLGRSKEEEAVTAASATVSAGDNDPLGSSAAAASEAAGGEDQSADAAATSGALPQTALDSCLSRSAAVSGALDRSGGRTQLNENAKVLMKDLRLLKVPMELLIMVDNSEECLLINRDNALIIAPYIPSFEGQRKAAATKASAGGGTGPGAGDEDAGGFGDPEEDEVLLSLMTFLEAMLVVPDVRSILRHGKVY